MIELEVQSYLRQRFPGRVLERVSSMDPINASPALAGSYKLPTGQYIVFSENPSNRVGEPSKVHWAWATLSP